MSTVAENNLAVPIDQMIDKLEPLLRRVVREELERVIEEKGNIFHLEPEMPLYQDMEEILNRKKEGKIEILLHGKKLTGSYALVRIDKSKNPKWLLIKRMD